MKSQESLTYYGLSDMGKQRTNNEDALVLEQLDDRTILAVTIDGVGGYEGGEVAAEIAQTEIPRYLREFRNGERLELLKQAVVCANNAIFSRRQVDAERSSMSCVLTSAIIDTNRKVIDMAHVGDTRLYQYHSNVITKLSHDHSLIGYREEMGDLTEEQAMHHPQRNVISRDVGSAMHEIADRDFIESEEFPLLPNSILLLCSDGLTDLITSQQIADILAINESLDSKAHALINAANEAGGKDNITVVLVEYQSDEKSEKLDNESSLTKINEINKVSAPSSEEQSKQIKTKNEMKRFNIYIVIAIVFSMLISICAALYGYSIHKELLMLENRFDNHLLFSEQENMNENSEIDNDNTEVNTSQEYSEEEN